MRLKTTLYLLYVIVGMIGLFVSLEGLVLVYESRLIALGTYTISLAGFAYGALSIIRNGR